MAKRIVRSSLPLENGKIQEEQIKLLDGNMTFSQMCEKGIIKPGMVMWFKKDEDCLIKVEHCESGASSKEYHIYLKKGIVVKDENGIFSIVSVLYADSQFEFSGRFARAYFVKTTGKILEAASFAYFKRKDACSLVSIDEYYFFTNNSKFFTQYIINHMDSNLFLGRGCYIYGSYIPKCFSLISRKGYYLIKICPDNIALKLCEITSKVATYEPYNFLMTPFNYYIENE